VTGCLLPSRFFFVAPANDLPAFRFLVKHFVTRARFFHACYDEPLTVAAFSALL